MDDLFEWEEVVRRDNKIVNFVVVGIVTSLSGLGLYGEIKRRYQNRQNKMKTDLDP